VFQEVWSLPYRHSNPASVPRTGLGTAEPEDMSFDKNGPGTAQGSRRVHLVPSCIMHLCSFVTMALQAVAQTTQRTQLCMMVHTFHLTATCKSLPNRPGQEGLRRGLCVTHTYHGDRLCGGPGRASAASQVVTANLGRGRGPQTHLRGTPPRPGHAPSPSDSDRGPLPGVRQWQEETSGQEMCAVSWCQAAGHLRC
jgi:hypothetical protein